MYVQDIMYGRFNEFECQVSPDSQNQHKALRARATLNVLGKAKHEFLYNCFESPLIKLMPRNQPDYSLLFNLKADFVLIRQADPQIQMQAKVAIINENLI